MCSSPKSNGCYVPAKKPTRSIMASFTTEQRRSFADVANRALERKEQRQYRQNRPVRARSSLKQHQTYGTKLANVMLHWREFVDKALAIFDRQT